VSGIVVGCQNERSKIQNIQRVCIPCHITNIILSYQAYHRSYHAIRLMYVSVEKAFQMLRSRLYEQVRRERDEKRRSLRKSQVCPSFSLPLLYFDFCWLLWCRWMGEWMDGRTDGRMDMDGWMMGVGVVGW
jgi:protein subunit release factor B